MATYTQKEKSIIDVGEVGNASTGDIIYDGGVKINDNFNAVYNVFGDQRLYALALGEDRQTLHATGYYQKLNSGDYGIAIEPGSMHDINTTGGPITVTLPEPKIGELCEFINSNGSWALNDVVFQPKAGTGSIAGNARIAIKNAYSKVTFVCIDETPSKAVWQYKVEPITGDFSVPINGIQDIDNTKTWPVRLFERDLYEGVKLVVSGVEIVAGQKKRTLSEILLMIDVEANSNKGIVYSDEYSVINNGENKTFNIDFSVNPDGYVYANVTTELTKLRFSIKSIETI